MAWVGGFFGNTIVWRGRKYYLRRDGRFEAGAGKPSGPVIAVEAAVLDGFGDVLGGHACPTRRCRRWCGLETRSVADGAV